MLADMAVVNLGRELLLDVDAGVTAMLVDRFQEFVFTEEVTVEDRTAAWTAPRRARPRRGPHRGRADPTGRER